MKIYLPYFINLDWNYIFLIKMAIFIIINWVRDCISLLLHFIIMIKDFCFSFIYLIEIKVKIIFLDFVNYYLFKVLSFLLHILIFDFIIIQFLEANYYHFEEFFSLIVTWISFVREFDQIFIYQFIIEMIFDQVHFIEYFYCQFNLKIYQIIYSLYFIIK